MPDPAITGDYESLEAALRARSGERYILRLFVTGGTFVSLRAIAHLRTICDKFLQGNYDLTIVDLRQQPELCNCDNLVAAPTLVKEAPGPEQRIVGDMSDTRSVLACLGLPFPTDGADNT